MYNSSEIVHTTEVAMSFLKDSSRHELRIKARNHTYLLIRSPYDEDTDFLYLLRAWGDAEPRTLHDDAEFAGVYSRLHERIVGGSLYLRDIVDDAYSDPLSAVLEAVSCRANEIVVQMIGNGPVPETEESDTPSRREEEFVAYGLEKEALTHFMDGTAPEYAPRIAVEQHCDTAIMVQIINHPEDAARAFAQRYIEQKSKIINQRMREIPLVARRILELAETPGEHHLRRAIARSIGDEKMVRLDLERDGQTMTVRIEASALKCTYGSSHYSTWKMDAQSRVAFENTFGHSAELYPGDIVRITYGNKTLYDKSRVQVQPAELSTAQFAAAFAATPPEHLD